MTNKEYDKRIAVMYFLVFSVGLAMPWPINFLQPISIALLAFFRFGKYFTNKKKDTTHE